MWEETGSLAGTDRNSGFRFFFVLKPVPRIFDYFVQWTNKCTDNWQWTEPTYMVRPCPKNGRRKITQNSIEVDAKSEESTRKTEEKLDGRYKERPWTKET